MNDDQEYASESVLNYRAGAALLGELVVDGTAGVADILCELLRSPHDISREVREILACAFERGRGGYRQPADPNAHVVRLIVEDFGPRNALFSAILVRRNWLEAAESCHELRQRGRQKDAAMVEAGAPFSLGYESMRKQALKFHQRLLAERADRESEVHVKVVACGFEPGSEDYDNCFRSIFVEREARRSTTGTPVSTGRG